VACAACSESNFGRTSAAGAPQPSAPRGCNDRVLVVGQRDNSVVAVGGQDRHLPPGNKVSEKGGVSVYGLGRFPVTLYKEQWIRLLDMTNDIRSFIEENESKLKAKE
jgi:hypothetical protein